LAAAISRISKKLGFDKAKFALDVLENKNYNQVVEIILFYYDKYYLKGLQKREESSIQTLEITSANHEEIANILISLIDQNNG
jgi:tRNA 2-selenouridine synthase